MQKFRAFCKRHKCIEEVFQITYLGDNDIKVEAECLSGYVGSDFILMQPTGLYDNNGVEIFEGDIVKYSDYEYSFTGIVTQDTVTCWWIKGIYPDDNFNFDDVTDYSEYTCDVKVIGNVHQHPELLEAT